MSAGAAWAVLARVGRSGQSSTLRSMMGDNTGTYWYKKNRTMEWKMIWVDYWASSIVSLTLVMSLGAVGPHGGP